MDLSIQRHTLAGADVFTVVGDVDTYSAAPLREQLTAITVRPDHLIVIDLSGVAFMDSAGLGVLVGALRRSRRHAGQLRLAGLRPAVSRVMMATGLLKEFHSYPDAATAVQG